MAITKFKLISDIEAQLLQGSPTDDSELSHEQIAYWIDYHLNDLIKQEITSYMKKGEIIPPVYIITQTGVTLSEENVAEIDDAKQRIYLTLTSDVLDLPDDRGIVRVEDYDGNIIRKTSIEELSMVRNLRFSRPSINNVLYYRIGKTVFVEGFNTADLDFNDVIVHYIPKQDVLNLADNAEIKITDQLIPILTDLCVQRGKLMLYGTQVDTMNDGVDHKNIQYHTAISNPTKNETEQ